MNASNTGNESYQMSFLTCRSKLSYARLRSTVWLDTLPLDEARDRLALGSAVCASLRLYCSVRLPDEPFVGE